VSALSLSGKVFYDFAVVVNILVAVAALKNARASEVRRVSRCLGLFTGQEAGRVPRRIVSSRCCAHRMRPPVKQAKSGPPSGRSRGRPPFPGQKNAY
jgi:hypothetical protein